MQDNIAEMASTRIYECTHQRIVAHCSAALASEAEHVRIWLHPQVVKEAQCVFCLQNPHDFQIDMMEDAKRTSNGKQARWILQTSYCLLHTLLRDSRSRANLSCSSASELEAAIGDPAASDDKMKETQGQAASCPGVCLGSSALLLPSTLRWSEQEARSSSVVLPSSASPLWPFRC